MGTKGLYLAMYLATSPEIVKHIMTLALISKLI
jgi:hypothetical protein